MPDFGQAFDEDEWETTGGGNSSKDFEKYIAAQKRARIEEGEKKAFPKPFEPRCHVCTHPFRDMIDSALIKSDVSFSELARRMPPAKNGRMLDHRQISTHSKKHLGVGDAAMRAILEEEAERSNKEWTENVRGAITHRGGLEIAFRKAFEDIVNGVASVEPRDMVTIAKLLKDWDDQSQTVQADYLRAQVSAIQEAVRQIVPREMWGDIAAKARSLMENDGLVPELPPAPPGLPQEVVEVVEEAVVVE